MLEFSRLVFRWPPINLPGEMSHQPDNIFAGTQVVARIEVRGPGKPRVIHEGVTELRAKAEVLRLRDSAPKPLLQGRHLIARGMQPGVQFGTLLDQAFEAQLEGGFTDLDGALKWLDGRN